MMPLSNRTNAQIKDLLTDYGIKHGPVVNSTRSLYERKLEEAMANDRTFYREEEEEITEIICRYPRRKKPSANRSAQVLPDSEQNGDQPPGQAEGSLSSGINQSSDAETSDDPKPEQQPADDNHNELEVKGPIRRQAAGKTKVVIPAVLALTALAAGCYYALPTVM